MGARKEALEMGLARKDGSGALLAAGDRLTGVLGSVAALITVEHGYEPAIAAALGAAADAIVVADVGSAVDALRLLKTDEAGRAGMLVDAPTVTGASPYDDRDTVDTAAHLPADTRWALDLVTAPAGLGAGLRRLLAGVVVVEGLAEARAVVEADRRLVAVTRDGDVLGVDRAAGGSLSTPTLLEVQAAVDEADARLTQATHTLDRLRFALLAAVEDQQVAARDVQAALDRLHESDARMAAVAEQLGQLGAQARAARGEAERLERAIEAASEQLADDRVALAELEERLTNAEVEPAEGEPDTDAAARAGRARAVGTGRRGRGPADRAHR